jgi:hypothetical protein
VHGAKMVGEAAAWLYLHPSFVSTLRNTFRSSRGSLARCLAEHRSPGWKARIRTG